MEVYEDIIKISKKDDGYTISIAISDNTVVTKVIDKNALHQLESDLRTLLQEEK